ncbi:calcium-binding protein [Rhodobacter sp. KR11]|uniref:EF-hand domain-containing protein n=1 Tax=Rhodobacter sp. KR11 TaxID=2974588 RepID=UPI0022230CC0|nr:calcium-binding protein [Rhodobacter sp. KR11]MCW1919721.1 calcium-binding protein [Rhodobacter sp. KR11]
MKMTQKTLGLSVIALAAALFASASLADNMGPMGPRGGAIAEADADKDGKITQAEFDAWKATLVAVIDTDKDGLLTADELAAARMLRAQDEAKDMAARMIARHDANSDGKLSAEELASGPTPGFAALDANSDGAVDQAELDAFRADHGPMDGEGRGKGHGEGRGKGHGRHQHGDQTPPPAN